MRLLFDIETNGLLDTATVVHCLVARDIDTNAEHVFRPAKIHDGLKLLGQADVLLGHNICGFDLPALAMLHGFVRPGRGGVCDTLAWSRASYPQMKVSDFATLRRMPDFPKNLIGRHSLESWGYRLDYAKGTFDHKTATGFSEEMLSYCRQDVELNVRLLQHLLKRGTMSYEAALVESEVAWILARQERHGFRFASSAAQDLYGALAVRRGELAELARTSFAPWTAPAGVLVPKRDNKKLGYTKGVPVHKTKVVEFNPASRDHIANRLQVIHGWVPEAFTPGGKPTIDDDVLAALPYPECPLLAEYLMVDKRIGQLAEGTKAWMKLERHGRIFGQTISTGTRTQRMSHSNPNVAQTPSTKSTFGKEMRALFLADKGWVLVGADSAGCQLRMLAHFLAPYDGGKFAEQVTTGDPHKYLLVSGAHCPEHDAASLEVRLACPLCREYQKTVTYAYLFGAGDKRLGEIVGRSIHYGGKIKGNMKRRLAGGGKKFDEALDAAFARKYVTLMDGRRTPTLARHDTLNTLLMASEAVSMKHALVEADWDLKGQGLVPAEETTDAFDNGDYEFVANIHDEWQVTCRAEVAEVVGKALTKAIAIIGERFGLGCALKGSFKVGANWSETH